MEVSLDVRKTVEESSATYFEASKKAKKKLAGAEQAIAKTEKQLEAVMRKKKVESVEQTKTSVIREKKWFEKFRWFISSEGFLCIGGRDATSNEIVVKKHTEKGDVVFHTEMAGSPFFVIKAENKKIGQQTLEETAIATASFSRAWRLGISQTEVFYVTPNQLSKTPKTGEYLEKGSFIVKGHVTHIIAELKLSVGMTKDNHVMSGPLTAVKANCSKHINITQGNLKSSEAAKKIRKVVGGEIDDIIRVLPSGGVKLV